MITRFRFFTVGLLLLAAGGTANVCRAADDADAYATRLKPLFRERCFSCHGALKQESSLRLDSVELMLSGGDSGPVITRGDAANSVLLERVTATDLARRMPPEHEGEPLSAEQIQLLRGWINGGAPAPEGEQPEPDPRDHWAFRTVARPDVPVVAKGEWVRNPIDAFLAAKHEQLGLVPQPEASREILLRRLFLGLIGVPPAAKDIAAFENDPSPEYYERTVDRLLNDPRYGERWGRHWMDIWRYSDWWGLGDQLRNSQKHIWHWRDWMIESLNADLPYDEMIRLMLAADELYPNDLDKLRASGYLARNYFLFNRNQWMEETVEHVSKGFLGLTMNCAKCHDHKFDPIAQHDFYSMRAFFEPYHVRVDAVPGEADLSRNGIPRAYDGHLDLPTYRFIRGQEKSPDTSTVIAPGVPSIFDFAELKIEPVALPADAWQPERRPWVMEAYLSAANQKVQTAELAVVAAREKGDAAQGELHVAELSLAAARAELTSVERRIAAMRASWSLADAGDAAHREELEKGEREAAQAAVRAEREAVVARAKKSVAEIELKLAATASDQKEPVQKELAAAQDVLTKAESQLAEPGEAYTKLTGAAWTATRFFNSTADDPTVEFPPTSSGRRSALANWIADKRNPLTARVAVNHIWMRHMGEPLVPTVFDFGRKGIPPLHPELLDWLAVEFMDSGWSMKHLHRAIVNSAAYRMSSSVAGGAEANAAIDGDNRFWWRRVPIRLESQVVRDSILSLAGTLDDAMGGPPVPVGEQADSTRRSLYFFHSNNERNLFLTTFDEALVKDCYRREQSIVPQQALALTNSQLVLDASPQIAQRISDGAADDTDFIRAAFVELLGIHASDAEIAASQHALDSWRKLSATSGRSEPDDVHRTHFIWVLLNHNDFVTLR